MGVSAGPLKGEGNREALSHLWSIETLGSSRTHPSFPGLGCSGSGDDFQGSGFCTQSFSLFYKTYLPPFLKLVSSFELFLNLSFEIGLIPLKKFLDF